MINCKHDFIHLDINKEEIICDDCGKDVCADLRKQLGNTNLPLLQEIAIQAKYAVTEACYNCFEKGKSDYCDKCHVRKLANMVKELR